MPTTNNGIRLCKERERGQHHYLNSSIQHFVQHMRASLHDLDVAFRGVRVLSVGDGVHEAVQVLVVLAQQVRLHELYHAVV